MAQQAVPTDIASGADDAALAQLRELFPRLDDPMWRLCNLYTIITKGRDDDEGLVVPFRPNRAQRRLLARLHSRNIILKARQLGFSTLVAILWLDTALFTKDPMRLGIIAHEREAAESIFRDKVVFAYSQLPEALRALMPIKSQTKTELVFAHNGASIRVATSMRSGTIHRLHISELGKIAAKYPAKAREVQTGSVPAVPGSGILIVESTAEGQDGLFYDWTQEALALQQAAKPLARKQFKLHFFAWWEDPDYRMPSEGMVYTDADRDYMLRVEARIKRRLHPDQWAWYFFELRTTFAGEAPLMWQEYPSFPEEAFQVSTDGCYYATQFALARRQGRILPTIPVERNAPCYTFWDLGRGDMTTIWVMQKVLLQHRFIRYYEASGEDLAHYAQWLLDTRLVFHTHYLPHDAAYRRLGENGRDTNPTQQEILEKLLPSHNFEVVPRVTNLQSGIQATRNALASAWFSEEGCLQGLRRAQAYRKKWDRVRGRWGDEDESNDDTHAADSLRQWGQEVEGGNEFGSGPRGHAENEHHGLPLTAGSRWRNRRKGSAMAA